MVDDDFSSTGRTTNLITDSKKISNSTNSMQLLSPFHLNIKTLVLISLPNGYQCKKTLDKTDAQLDGSIDNTVQLSFHLHLSPPTPTLYGHNRQLLSCAPKCHLQPSNIIAG